MSRLHGASPHRPPGRGHIAETTLARWTAQLKTTFTRARALTFVLLLAVAAIPACVSIPAERGVGDQRTGLERGGWQDRYFKFDGRYPYIVGFDVQQLHADTGIDYEAKLDFLAAHDINKVRIWLNPSWFGLPGDRNYPTRGRILYPWRVDESVNRFDLDAWDPAFWSRTRAFMEAARRRDIVVEVSLFSVQGPRNFFRDPQISYPFHHKDNIQDFGRPTDRAGGFLGGFFDLAYTDNGFRLADYQRAYIDKALDELGSFNHVYYEIMNEAPGEPHWVRRESSHAWIRHWIAYIRARTDQIITTHSTGFMTLRNDNERGWTAGQFSAVGARYWDDTAVDGFNFHLYSTDPAAISTALAGYQTRGRMLICNEGGSFYDIDRSRGYPDFAVTHDPQALYGEIRHAWGMMTAGGYYSVYYGPVPQLGDASSVAAARVMRAMRHIVEMADFHEMRPVRDDGTEYDDLVTQGPGSGWQVIADEGRAWLVYFWGTGSDTVTSITLPPGRYRYDWMDTRRKRRPLRAGRLRLDAAGQAQIPAPRKTDWHPGAGVVLVIRET